MTLDPLSKWLLHKFKTATTVDHSFPYEMALMEMGVLLYSRPANLSLEAMSRVSPLPKDCEMVEEFEVRDFIQDLATGNPEPAIISVFVRLECSGKQAINPRSIT